MNDKNFEKINIKIVISRTQCIPEPNFSQFEELKFFEPDLPKKTLGLNIRASTI